MAEPRRHADPTNSQQIEGRSVSMRAPFIHFGKHNARFVAQKTRFPAELEDSIPAAVFQTGNLMSEYAAVTRRAVTVSFLIVTDSAWPTLGFRVCARSPGPR